MAGFLLTRTHTHTELMTYLYYKAASNSAKRNNVILQEDVIRRGVPVNPLSNTGLSTQLGALAPTPVRRRRMAPTQHPDSPLFTFHFSLSTFHFPLFTFHFSLFTYLSPMWQSSSIYQ